MKSRKIVLPLSIILTMMLSSCTGLLSTTYIDDDPYWYAGDYAPYYWSDYHGGPPGPPPPPHKPKPDKPDHHPDHPGGPDKPGGGNKPHSPERPGGGGAGRNPGSPSQGGFRGDK